MTTESQAKHLAALYNAEFIPCGDLNKRTWTAPGKRCIFAALDPEEPYDVVSVCDDDSTKRFTGSTAMTFIRSGKGVSNMEFLQRVTAGRSMRFLYVILVGGVVWVAGAYQVVGDHPASPWRRRRLLVDVVYPASLAEDDLPKDARDLGTLARLLDEDIIHGDVLLIDDDEIPEDLGVQLILQQGILSEDEIRGEHTPTEEG